MARTWLLREVDYDGGNVIGSFATERQAKEVKAALGDDHWTADFYVDSIDVLPADVHVEKLGTRVDCHLAVHWDGKVRSDTDRQRPIVRVVGLPEALMPPRDIDPTAEGEYVPPPVCVETQAFEQEYTLGFYVSVFGSDPEQVRARYADERDAALADPPGRTVAAWKARGHPLPGWVWQRPENAGLLPALRAVGVT